MKYILDNFEIQTATFYLLFTLQLVLFSRQLGTALLQLRKHVN